MAQRSSARYFAFGLNHESTPIAVREPFEMGADRLRLLAAAVSEDVSAEWMVLSTCNRTECYGYGSVHDMNRLRARIAHLAGSEWPVDRAFALQGTEAVGHVIEVTAGLKSQVLGDVQILTQVKSAYRAAHAGETIGPHVHRLMHTALATAKRVLTETGLSRGNPSIASLAARVARRIVAATPSVSPPVRALVLGTGEMGCRLGRILFRDRAVETSITNRSRTRAHDVGRRLQANVVPWQNRLDAVARADVVFVTTSSPSYVLSAETLAPPVRPPVLIVDIAVPRNVDPAVGDLAGYRLLDIDALREIESEERDRQARGYARAVELCRAATRELLEWERQQRLLRPAIETLHEAFESVRTQVLEQNLYRFAPEDHEQVDHLTQAITQKLLAIPLVRLKQLSSTPSAPLEQQITALASLFTRPDCEEEDPSHE